MAGAGWRDFTAGEQLTDLKMQDYLQDQAVMLFTNAAARGSALAGVVSEGMVTTLTDTDKIYRYDGTQWRDVQSTDITAYTASSTATAAIANKMMYFTAAGTAVIPDVLQIGEQIQIVRETSGTVSIAAGSGVTNWAGAGTAGTAVVFRIERQYGAAAVMKTAANTYRVFGRVV